MTYIKRNLNTLHQSPVIAANRLEKISEEIKEIAKPFVPKRPALPTRWRY